MLLPAREDGSVTADCAGDAVTVRVDRPGLGVDTITWSGTADPALGAVVLTLGARHGLAADAALPARDLLLDQDAAGEHLARLLGRDVTGCELVRVKYRIGESMRVTYRLVADGERELLTVRAFRPGQSGSAYRKAAGPGVWPDPALDAVWWAFPADRRLRGLADLLSPGPELAALAPGWVAGELVEYSPERAATFRALDATGTAVGYAKAYAPGTVDVVERSDRYARIAAVLAAGGGAGGFAAPVPLGRSEARTVLVLQPMPGVEWGQLTGPALAAAMGRLGSAIATLHAAGAAADGLPRFGRLDVRRVVHSAHLVAVGRPDVSAAAIRLADRLADGAAARRPAGRAARRLPPQERAAGRRVDRVDRPRPGRRRSGRRGRRQPRRPAARRRRHRRAALGVPVRLPGRAAAAAGPLAALAHRRRAGGRAGRARGEPGAPAHAGPAPGAPGDRRRRAAERSRTVTRDRLLFYCQHSLGLGHLARSLRLAEGLTERFDVRLLNGGRFPAGTRVPAGVSVINLPPLGHDADGMLVSHDPAYPVEQACARRAELLLATLDDARPAVLLIEMYPFGRRKFEFELVPLLDAAAALGADRPRVVCSLRDILVQRAIGQDKHDERAVTRLNASFDAIVMHADPAFATLAESFRPAIPLRVPVHYTGFVAPPAPAPVSDRLARLVVSSGGGMVGEPLVRAAVEVHRDLFIRTGLRTTVVAGPFLPEPVWAWLREQATRSPVLEVVRRVDDLAGEIARSALSL